MYSTIVGAGALDSPFLGAARFEFIQTLWATKGRPYKKSSPQGDTIIPHSSFLIPHSSLDRQGDKIYKKLIKFFDK